ncbi:MAG: rod shape-determining protein MreD, partial [Nocardiopsaceae bacterium]|nr:rod shape-determining protein MreD [Nocardiopsaceae bacterium]
MTAVRRICGIPVTLLIAVVAQVAIINRLPLPGDAGPDVVLLAVTAIGAMFGPMTGTIVGFCGGLALDVAPPSGHLAGEYALVFCLAGYACGRMRNLLDPLREHGTLTSMTVMMVGAAGGEAAKAALGLMLSDPDMTGPAIRQVLPAAIVYNLLFSPFVLWLVVLAVGRPARPSAVSPHRTAPRTAPQYGAVRLATAGS